ncbi:pentapeptide repeat-containing protein [Salinibacter ruber]|jgi:uncharacterized protein YjbI with pentapeptide repeats
MRGYSFDGAFPELVSGGTNLVGTNLGGVNLGGANPSGANLKGELG